MFECFEATIYFKRKKAKEGISAEELIQTVEETKDKDISIIIIWLSCGNQEDKEENNVLVSDWKKVMNNQRIQELSKLITVNIYHGYNFDKETTDELKRELRKSIERGNNFQRISYGGPGSKVVQEVEVFTQYMLDLSAGAWKTSSVKHLDIKIHLMNHLAEPFGLNSFEFHGGTKFEVCVQDPKHFLTILSTEIIASEQVKDIKIRVTEELREDLEKFVEAIDTNNCLLNFVADVAGTNLKLPEELKTRIKENFAKKMAFWIRNRTRVDYGRMKVMLVGRGQAGKSSTVRSLLNQPFDKNIASTVVGEADKDVSINVQDVSAAWKATNEEDNWVSEELGEYMGKLKENRQIIVADSFSQVGQPQVNAAFKEELIQQSISEEVEQHQKNKVKYEISQEVQKSPKKAKTRMLGFINIKNRFKRSDKKTQPDGENNARLTIWDFGGQEVFYALHHLYLTTGGLYVLVFDLQLIIRQMDSEMKLIQFWIESIQINAPGASVALVGTRCYKLSKEVLKKIDLELRSVIEEKDLELLTSKELIYFPIDNAKPKLIQKQIQPLRAKILHCFERESLDNDLKTNIWQKKISLSWIYFMNHLLKRFKGVISSNQLFQIANDLGLEKERDVIPMLEFYKNAGGIIPFMKEDNIESWKFSYVVLSPEWLLKVIGNFIYEEGMHQMNQRFYENGETRSLITNYEKSGVLSKGLLLQILREANVSASDADFIINMSKEMLLLSEFDCNPEWSKVEGESFYMVPTMNRQVADKVEIMKQASPDDCVNFYIHCHTYIPVGVFERITCIMLSLNSNFGGATIEPVIKKNFACFVFREVEIYVENQNENRDFRVSVSKDEAEELNVLLNVVNLIEEGLDRMRSDVLGQKINIELQVESSKAEKMRCSWNDLKSSIENNESTKVKVILSDGRNKLKKYSLFDPFDQVAELALERERDDILLEQEKNELKWYYHCFLAHSWGKNNETHEKVVEIAKLLNERNLITWLDENDLKHYISNDIVRGVRTSASILVFITEHYLLRVEDKNSNASKEFAQAAAKGGKYLVPVVLDPKCLNPASWAGSMVSYHMKDALYFDFSSPEKIKANIEQLCQRIEEMSDDKRPRNSFDTDVCSF